MPVDHTQTIIFVKDLSFAYGTTPVLSKVSLDIHKGDYLGIVGPNGGGKTTLIKLILGLLKAQQGNITLFNKPLEHFNDWSKIGYIAQKATHFDQFFPATVKDVVRMGRITNKKWFGGFNNEDEQQVSKALKKVGLEKYAETLIGNLSGGQQQRVFIARALAQQAEVLFLDEPTTGVDANTQEEFYSLLRELNHELGITLVIISHEQDVVRNEVTEVACVNLELNYHGTSAEFLKSASFEQMYGTNVKAIHHHHD